MINELPIDGRRRKRTAAATTFTVRTRVDFKEHLLQLAIGAETSISEIAMLPLRAAYAPDELSPKDWKLLAELTNDRIRPGEEVCEPDAPIDLSGLPRCHE